MSAPEYTESATTDLQFTDDELTALAVATYTEATGAPETDDAVAAGDTDAETHAETDTDTDATCSPACPPS